MPTPTEPSLAHLIETLADTRDALALKRDRNLRRKGSKGRGRALSIAITHIEDALYRLQELG